MKKQSLSIFALSLLALFSLCFFAPLTYAQSSSLSTPEPLLDDRVNLDNPSLLDIPLAIMVVTEKILIYIPIIGALSIGCGFFVLIFHAREMGKRLIMYGAIGLVGGGAIYFIINLAIAFSLGEIG